MGNGNNNYRLIYEHHRQFTKFLAKVKVKMNTPWYRNTLQTSKLAFNPQRKQTQRIWKAIIKNRCYFFFSVCQNVRSFICVPLKIWMQILWGHLWSVLFNKHALTHRIYIHQYRNDLNGMVCRRLTHTHTGAYISWLCPLTAQSNMLSDSANKRQYSFIILLPQIGNECQPDTSMFI